MSVLSSLLSPERIRALEAHFSDALLQLQSEIHVARERLQEQITMLLSTRFTDSARLYANLRPSTMT